MFTTSKISNVIWTLLTLGFFFGLLGVDWGDERKQQKYTLLKKYKIM